MKKGYYIYIASVLTVFFVLTFLGKRIFRNDYGEKFNGVDTHQGIHHK